MKRLFAIFFILSASLAACTKGAVAPNLPSLTPGAPTTVPTPAITAGPPTPGTPQPGMASVTGRLFALQTGNPLAHTDVRLAEVVHIPPNNDTFMLNDASSPGAYSDGQGYFVISNVAVKGYVIIVGDINMSFAVATAEPDKAKVWTLTANTITNVGDIRVVLN